MKSTPLYLFFPFLFLFSSCSNSTDRSDQTNADSNVEHSSSNTEEAKFSTVQDTGFSLVGVWEGMFDDDIEDEEEDMKEALSQLAGAFNLKLAFDVNGEFEMTTWTIGHSGKYTSSKNLDTVLLKSTYENENGKIIKEVSPPVITNKNDNTLHLELSDFNGEKTKIVYTKKSDHFSTILDDENLTSIDDLRAEYFKQKQNAATSSPSSTNSFGDRLNKMTDYLGQVKQEINNYKDGEPLPNLNPDSLAAKYNNQKSGEGDYEYGKSTATITGKAGNSRLIGSWKITGLQSTDNYESGEINLLRQLEIDAIYQFNSDGSYTKTRSKNKSKTGKYKSTPNQIIIYNNLNKGENYEISEMSSTTLKLKNIEYDIFYYLEKVE